LKDPEALSCATPWLCGWAEAPCAPIPVAIAPNTEVFTKSRREKVIVPPGSAPDSVNNGSNSAWILKA
jgi:hypothetical protein